MNIEGIPKPSDWTNIGGFVAPQNKEEENVEIKPIVHNFIGDTAATSTGNTTPPVVSKIDLNTAYMLSLIHI